MHAAGQRDPGRPGRAAWRVPRTAVRIRGHALGGAAGRLCGRAAPAPARAHGYALSSALEAEAPGLLQSLADSGARAAAQPARTSACLPQLARTALHAETPTRAGCGAAGLAASLGTGTSLMLTVAHELLHSPRAVDKAMCNLLLSAAGYMHWGCSHLAHHRMVRPALQHPDPNPHALGLLPPGAPPHDALRFATP